MTLLERLRECVTDEREIEQVLLRASGGGAQFDARGFVEYRSNGNSREILATVKYKQGRMASLTPGPALHTAIAQDELLAKAKEETAHTHGTFIATRVLFSERPLLGAFVWNDEVRLSPCPETAPTGKGLDWFGQGLNFPEDKSHLGPPFPFLLEVRIPRSPNALIEGTRALRRLDMYQHLFTVLLTGNIGYAHWQSGRVWALLKVDELPANHLVQPGFSAGENGRQEDFAETTSPFAPVFENGDYYNNLWGQDTELFVPKSIAGDLQLFRELPFETSTAFVRACYWYALGTQFRAEPSLATIALSTAIECLLPRPSSAACPKCNKPTGPGPTQLFNRHVIRYGAVSTALHDRRKALYAVRSALVHGSYASRVDVGFMSVQRHAGDHLMLLQIVAQRSLLNWLRDADRAIWHLEKAATHGCSDK